MVNLLERMGLIVALRNEKGSYNKVVSYILPSQIVALRNEKGSYNEKSNEE